MDKELAARRLMGTEMKRKSRDILKAISAGRSCEQILANDGSLTYRDIFHVVTEAPTSFWMKAAAGRADQPKAADNPSARTVEPHRRD